jgi:phosphoadenosine phosphosulfate reductase
MIAEQIDIEYDEALSRCNPSLRDKLERSVSLLRKAESIAKMYDSEEGFFLAFSGGKDSQALYHVAKIAGVRFKGHFSPTSVDPGELIRFIKTEYPSVVRHRLETNIYRRAVERKILPTMRVRWCCADFKETAGAGKVTLIGIRAKESARRAKRHEVEVSNKRFSGSLDEFEEWSRSEIERKQKKKAKRKINEDEFSIKTDSEIRCINGKDSILISPIFDWTEKDVWYFLNNVVKAPHCSLYDEGYTRIGCILCPMATYKSKLRDIERFPHVKRKWIEAIKAIRNERALHTIRGLWGNRENPRECASEKNSSIRHGSNTTRTGLYYGATNPQYVITQRTIRCVSDSPAAGGVATGQWTEDEIAEAIFDWWISGKPYKQWYAEKYLQKKIDFDEHKE